MSIHEIADEAVDVDTLGVKIERAKVRRRRGWKIAVALAAGTIALLLGAYVVLDFVDRGAGEAAIERVREAGDPVTPQELAAFYKSSPEIEQATEHWSRAFEASESGNSTESLREIRLARKAGAVGRFPRILDGSDSETATQHLEGLRGLADDLSLPLLFNDEDAVDEAAETLLDMVAVNEALKNEPTGTSFLVRCSLLGGASYDALGTLAQCPYGDEHLLTIQQAFERQDLHADLLHAIRGEQAIVLQSYEHGIPGDPYLKRALSLPFRGGDRAYAVEWFQAYLKDAEGGWAEMARAADDVNARVESLIASTFEQYRFGVAAQRMHYPAMLLHSAQRVQTDSNVVVAFAACRRYRLANGEWPESLEALVPTYLSVVPIDPRSVQPLVYERDGDTIRIRTQVYTSEYAGMKLSPLDQTGQHVFDAATFETAKMSAAPSGD